MPKVFELGFVALGVKDFAKMRDYYVDTLGTTEVDKDTDGAIYLSVGANHHWPDPMGWSGFSLNA